MDSIGESARPTRGKSIGDHKLGAAGLKTGSASRMNDDDYG